MPIDEAMPDLEPRIPPLGPDELSEDALEVAAIIRGIFGLATTELPESVATMLRHPVIYRAFANFAAARHAALTIDRRDLEIFVLRTGRLCGSHYVWGEHVAFAKQAGATAEEIERAVTGSAHPDWNDRDRALNRMSEELHETAFVSDETWAVMAAHFTDQQLMELLMMAGAYHEIAYLYNAMRVRLIPGNQGLAAR